jgi:hypothetical protein
MKWSELPKEYRDLEIPEEAKNDSYDFDSDYLTYKFNWSKSNQGSIFWQECKYAKSIDDLPPIPKPKMTEQFKEAGEKAKKKKYADWGARERYWQNLLKEAKEYIEMQDDQIKNLRNELSLANQYETTTISDGNGKTFVEKTRKIMEPAFYMIYVEHMSAATVKHKTLDDAINEANRIAATTNNVVHILAHHESYQRKVTIELIK